MIKWTRAPAFNKDDLMDIYAGLMFLQVDLLNKQSRLPPIPSLDDRIENVSKLIKKIMNEIEKLNRSR